MSLRDPERPEPDFAGDAARAFAREWAGYARVAISITIRPRAFVRAWISDPRSALNPIAAMLQSVAIVAAWSALCIRFLRPDINVPWWVDALLPVAQLFLVVLVGTAFHLPLKLLGAERRLHTTVGVLCYLTAGPLLVMRLVTTPVALAVSKQPSVYAYALSAATAIVTIAYYVVGMGAAHRISWWRVLVAILIGVVVLSILTVVVASTLVHYFHLKTHAGHISAT